VIVTWEPLSYIGPQVELFIFGSGPTPVSPTCTLSASLPTINLGGSSTLTWTTANSPVSAIIDNGIGAVNPAGGSLSVSPILTTTYHLTVANESGVSNCQTTITVIQPAPPVAPPPNPPIAGVCAPHIDCTIELYKNPGDIDTYTFDWSGYLGTDTIASTAWAVFPSGVMLSNSVFTNTTTSLTLAGGADPIVYLLRNSILTASGRTLVRSARLFVNISHAVPAAPIQ
jgi:hypothetical protein